LPLWLNLIQQISFTVNSWEGGQTVRALFVQRKWVRVMESMGWTRMLPKNWKHIMLTMVLVWDV